MDYIKQDLQYSASQSERADFYKKTYLHVALAILAFAGLEYVLLQIEPLVHFMRSIRGVFWLGLLGAFYLITMFADKLAYNMNRGQQYLGLGLYVIAYAVLFVPLISVAEQMGGRSNIIGQAGIITLALFAGLTGIAFFSNTDFSFLKKALIIGGFIALGLIVAGTFFGGFSLGLWFSLLMVLLSAGSILYHTSNLKYRYPTTHYVGAAVGLFASIMTLFWYILRIVMSRD